MCRNSGKRLVTGIAIFGLLLSVAAMARADTLTLNLLSPVYGGSGSTISISGTITAPGSNTSVIFLNGDSLGLTGPFTLDDAPFLTNAPLSMSPGGSYTGTLFNVAIGRLASQGSYTGFFTILGGANAATQASISNAAPFNVTVTPEPATLTCVAATLLGFLWVAQVRRMRAGRARVTGGPTGEPRSEA